MPVSEYMYVIIFLYIWVGCASQRTVVPTNPYRRRLTFNAFGGSGGIYLVIGGNLTKDSKLQRDLVYTVWVRKLWQEEESQVKAAVTMVDMLKYLMEDLQRQALEALAAERTGKERRGRLERERIPVRGELVLMTRMLECRKLGRVCDYFSCWVRKMSKCPELNKVFLKII